MVASITRPVLLLVLSVSALGWENLPAIPAGRRAEYYLQQDDGAYKFGYDTGEGQSAAATADQSNQVQGQYSYVDKAGKRVSLAYTAGDSGFVPRLDIDGVAASRAGASGIPGAGFGNSIASYKTPAASGFASDGSQGGDAGNDPNADASYSFSIDTDSYKRTESSDAKGNVRGQYSYNSQLGGNQVLSYIAGEGTGFVVNSGDNTGAGVRAGVVPSNAYVPSAPSPYSGGPAADTRSNFNNDGSYSFSFNTNDQSRDETADSQNNVRGSYSFKAKDDGQIRRVDYSAGSATGFVAAGGHLPVSPSTSQSSLGYSSFGQSGPSPYSSPGTGTSQGGVGPDGSYSFSYNSGDSSRQESADAQNNVRGSFSFKAKDDGQARRVDYEAGAATGFVAKGSHLPVAPNPVSLSTGGFGSQPAVVSSYSSGPSGSEGDEAPSGDASYAFSYNTGDQSRQEASDSQGNVNGQYSFVATDGVQRKVDYTAGVGKGFIAKVDSGVNTPQSASAYSSIPSSVSYYSSGIGTSPVGTSFPSQPSASSYSSGIAAPTSSSGPQSDGSYSFSYNTADQSREESGDAHNNVRGSYSFKAKDDGQSRRVDYEAGAATGFIAKGAHIPVPSSGLSATSYSQQPFSSSPYSGSGISAAAKSSVPSSDGSYSFSYNAGDHSREESADAQGNVRGRFSFAAKDDGQTRQIDYEAGAEKGFIAKGAHIPAGVSGASAIAASGFQASSAGGYQAPAAYQGVVVDSSQGDGSSGDASYSYNYQTDSSSKQETSDAQGNVAGTFSYVGGDGVSRSVQYSSRGNDGFVVSGEHLPTNGVSSGFGASNVLSAGGYSAGARSSHGKSLQDIGTAGFRLQKYLPPESPRKFGYIFDTQV